MLKKFEVCVRAKKLALFKVEAVDSAAAQEAALELAEDFDWDAVVVDDWFEVAGPAIENEPSAADLSKTK